jgi:2-keto-4-pentenoate hydratase/2-oxohepta-3-ene-1,7-dioic acid hydratase in catechol pathway
MKLASIVRGDITVGVVSRNDDQLVLLSDLGPWTSVRELVTAGDAALATVRAGLQKQGLATIAAAGVTWAAPIPDPSKMLFMALNNSAIDKTLYYRPDFPVYFPKLPSTLAGSGATLELHGHYGLTHLEPELGVIIGKTACAVSLRDAMDYVFGYTVVNDVTSVGMRMEDKYFGRYPMPKPNGGFEPVDEHLLYPGRYKNVDGFAPMGPYLVTKDAIPDPHDLRVRGWVDEELFADDTTRNLHYTVAEVIHWVSTHSTLMPGDILSMGTAVHPDAKSKPLSSSNVNSFGDVMRVEIERIGTVETRVKRIRDADPRDYFAANRRFVKTLVE